MSQNKNKLINLFIGNISNSAVHTILEKAIEEENIRKHYDKESLLSFEVAKKYRNKINPKNTSLPEKDVKTIKAKIIIKVNAELRLRISKGYQNINLELVSPVIDKLLKKTKIT
ncbi:MAG: hypothetical protein KKF46_01125 [Nanoarchaeota archaeon]|nr:hypothetical protein [Nanoarchaeota archaeon]MBU1597273.1 hypothetical protein [Nanoarchaeota archaeon]MBU2440805.1 hypothetical protein [Nanoarchaeota archaeon]